MSGKVRLTLWVTPEAKERIKAILGGCDVPLHRRGEVDVDGGALRGSRRKGGEMSGWLAGEDACGRCVFRNSIAVCPRFGKAKRSRCGNYLPMSFTVSTTTSYMIGGGAMGDLDGFEVVPYIDLRTNRGQKASKDKRIARLELERDALAADLADAMARIDALEAVADEMLSMLREAATASNVDEVVEVKRRLAAVKAGVIANGRD